MIGRAEYFSPARAAYLLRALFAWLVLEAHDKGCVERVFGPRPPSVPGVSTAEDRHASPHAAPGLVAHSAQALASVGQLLRQLLHLPYRMLFASAAGSSALHHDGTTAHQIANSGWRSYVVDGMPRQQDDSSCGVFMTAFATQVLTGHAPPYQLTQADVPVLRTALAAMLLDLPSAPQLAFADQPFSLPVRNTWWAWG